MLNHQMIYNPIYSICIHSSSPTCPTCFLHNLYSLDPANLLFCSQEKKTSTCSSKTLHGSHFFLGKTSLTHPPFTSSPGGPVTQFHQSIFGGRQWGGFQLGIGLVNRRHHGFQHSNGLSFHGWFGVPGTPTLGNLHICVFLISPIKRRLIPGTSRWFLILNAFFFLPRGGNCCERLQFQRWWSSMTSTINSSLVLIGIVWWCISAKTWWVFNNQELRHYIYILIYWLFICRLLILATKKS